MGLKIIVFEREDDKLFLTTMRHRFANIRTIKVIF